MPPDSTQGHKRHRKISFWTPNPPTFLSLILALSHTARDITCTVWKSQLTCLSSVHIHQIAILGEHFVPEEWPWENRLSKEAREGPKSRYKVIGAEGLRNPEHILNGEIKAPGKHIPSVA